MEQYPLVGSLPRLIPSLISIVSSGTLVHSSCALAAQSPNTVTVSSFALALFSFVVNVIVAVSASRKLVLAVSSFSSVHGSDQILE
jgi:hypothetical protein